MIARVLLMTTHVIALIAIFPCASNAEDVGDPKGNNKETALINPKDIKSWELIKLREAEIKRAIARIVETPEKETAVYIIRGAAAHTLVELRAIEAVPTLCSKIALIGDGLTSFTTRPAAEALVALGGSAVPGIFDSLATSEKSDLEIRLFAFVLASIDKGDNDLSVFRIERENKRSMADTMRNNTFRANNAKLLKCFSTPDFFRFENNPFYAH